MTRDRLVTGRIGEDTAVAWLERRGMRVHARNWRCRQGEIDIVARDGRWLVVVEVRARRGRSYGTPEESVTGDKRRRLVTLGSRCVQDLAWEGPWRIDVVAVDLTSDGRAKRVRHYPNAVTAA